MYKLLAFFIALNFVFLITDGAYEDTAAFQTTYLTANIDDNDTTIPVNSTTGFADKDKTITINGEDIYYTSKDATHFYLTSDALRGYNKTTSTSHLTNAMVYNRGASLANELVDYEVSSTGSTASDASVIDVTWKFATRTIPKMISWNYAIFNGDLVIIRYFLMMLGAALTLVIGLSMLGIKIGL
jgi:hypothetical protein